MQQRLNLSTAIRGVKDEINKYRLITVVGYIDFDM